MRRRVVLALRRGVARLPAAAGAKDEGCELTGAARVVAIGDVHGAYPEFLAVLRLAGLIDAKDRWSGGKTHFVQTGDILDRGTETRPVMELLMRLEGEAKKAGGRVHALLGNHEVMNVLGDLRYVSREEYKAFETPRSRETWDDVLPLARERRAAGRPGKPSSRSTRRRSARSSRPTRRSASSSGSRPSRTRGATASGCASVAGW